MARLTRRPPATQHEYLVPEQQTCWHCRGPLWAAWHRQRTITTLDGVLALKLQVRRCVTATCPAYHRPYRPEAEGFLALPHHEFGFDVIALAGRLRVIECRSVPEIHQRLTARGVAIAERTVPHLLARYEELLALHLSDGTAAAATLRAQGAVVLALDGMQPDVGHEVLWVVRDVLSGTVLLARTLLGATVAELVTLLTDVGAQLPAEVPVRGVVSDGQRSIRQAVRIALPGVPHQLCHFHYLREAAQPIFEVDRHAKKELKKRVRGVRPLERMLAGRTDATAEALRGYCLAVRSALTDDGRPPLAANGLVLHERLTAITRSLQQVTAALTAAGGKRDPLLMRLTGMLTRALDATATLWPAIRRTYAWVHRAAQLLDPPAGTPGDQVRRQLRGLLRAMMRWRHTAGPLAAAVAHFSAVTRRYQAGLFHCYDIPGCPRTNNDLEQLFGTVRYRERRASGRTRASPSLVLRGSVRVLAVLGTLQHPCDGTTLVPRDLSAWQRLRAELTHRARHRRAQRRFRRAPGPYLAALESQVLHACLPS